MKKKTIYKTFGNISNEVYIEKIVPQWAETQLDKQNAQNILECMIKKQLNIKSLTIYIYVFVNHDGIVSPCTLDWPRGFNRKY